MLRAMMCPQCNAPLTPHQFARSIVCSYCGATIRLDDASVLAARFREALQVWNNPGPYQLAPFISIGEAHWTLEKDLAHGEFSDVYFGRRARWPTELVILKLLRDPAGEELFENEWSVLRALQESPASGAGSFSRLLPQPVLHGRLSSASHRGTLVSIFRWTAGFEHTFEDVRRAYPQGIPPQASIWVWRRILEMLSFLHASGTAHGALIPANLLIQRNEHGVRLVGYSRAGRLGAPLPSIPQGSEAFYPTGPAAGLKMSEALDLALSARTLTALLGGDPQSGSLPAEVPAPLANLLRRVASGTASQSAWALREELGELSNRVFGPPRFMPLIT